jgi:hypothetical protein
LPKRGHTEDEYEDAWVADLGAMRFAVADGASESAFAGLWARLLVEGFVAAPRPRDLLPWLGGARRRWSEAVMGLEVPWYVEMKRAEGAFATLVGLVVRPPTPGRPGRWRAVAVGDSCMVLVRGGRLAKAFPLASSSDFGNEPRLIGSRAELRVEPRHSAGALHTGDRLLLMTDALAQWFLSAHEGGECPWEAVAPLLSEDQPARAFATWIEHLREGGGLRDDDVTLLTIEPDCPPEE